LIRSLETPAPTGRTSPGLPLMRGSILTWMNDLALRSRRALSQSVNYSVRRTTIT